MLIGIMVLASVIGALAIAAAAGGFSSLAWIWILPLSFIGCFLIAFLLAFLFLWLVSAVVDQKKPQEEDSPFYRGVARAYLPAIFTLLQEHVHTEGMEKLPENGRFLLVCNHLSVMDPLTLFYYFRNHQLAFISKKENQDMLIVGGMMHKLMCQPIDRENDRSALRTIINCINLIKQDKASIGVFPEGYTSKDGLLHPFRHGVFKIAQKAQVPIVVCTLQNTRSIFRNAIHLRPTHVQLHLLEVIPPEELKGVTAVSVGERVHKIMADDLGPDLVEPVTE